MSLIYKVMINDAIRLDCKGSDLRLKKNDWCIVRTDRYQDYGRVTSIGEMVPSIDAKKLPVVKRQATLVDQGKANENNVRCKSLQRTAEEKIGELDLPMRIISTHLTFDRSLAIFVFTAPGRVDFRQLVRDLNKSMNLRVELRQIGPRDQAGITGGFGSCGRVLCCSSFLTNFVSINVKMAKEQGVSLNPSNIIGACGRLKCCLEYEYEGYKLLAKSMPRVGSRCTCNGCNGKIVDRNPIAQTVRVALEKDGGVVTVPISEISTT